MNSDSPPSGSLPKSGIVGASTGSASPPGIPDHQLLRLIGRGAYGQVWLARNVMGTYRAIKLVYRSDFEHARPFEREFEGIRKFEPVSRTDESQVDILQVGRNDQAGYFYYVMELADDEETGQEIDPGNYSPKSLRSELHRRERLSLEACLQIGLALTMALEHLHQHGLVHRDVKPSNIIFVNGRPKLADIGLVASTDATMSFVGTAGYLPPEGPGTPQADIYSLGKVLYEVCTGRDRQNFPELPTEWEQFINQEGLLEFNAVLLRACESDVRRRYQSAQEMHADLALLQTGKSVKRLRVIERRLAAITRIGIGAAAIAVVAVAAYFGAIKQARRAQRAEREIAQQLYAADINRAMHQWEQGNVKRAIELLDAHQPKLAHASPSQDLRSFEWFYLWHLCHTDEALYTFRVGNNGILSASFSPDGLILASNGSDSTLILWDISSRQPLATLTNFGGYDHDWEFTPDSKAVAYATATGSIELWDIWAKRVLAALPSTNQSTYCMSFSPDAKLLALVENSSTIISMWEVASGRLLDTLQSEEGGYVYGLAHSPDGQTLAAGHRDNLVTFWNASKRQKLADAKIPIGFASKLVFSPDSKTLAIAGVNSIVALCDVNSRKTLGVLSGHGALVRCVAYSPDGRTIATGSDDSTVRLWDSQSLQAVATLKGHLSRVLAVAFSDRGTHLASVADDGEVKLWDADPKTNPDVLTGHTDWARSVAFSPDSKMLASAGKDKSIILWDVATGHHRFSLFGHQRPVYRLAFSSDGRTLATVSGLVTEPNGPGEVKLWDTVEQTEIATLTNQNNFACAVAFARDGRTLATGNANGSVVLWNSTAQRPIATLIGHSNQVQGLAFSPDGKLLATASFDNWVKLWDLSTRRELLRLPGSAGNQVASGFAVWCVAFSPDGQTLAVGNDDGTVMLWSVSTRKLIRSLEGTGGKIYSIAFAPDGKTLVTGNQNGTVGLWHLATGQDIVVLNGHQDSVESVALSPDGAILASASADKTVRLWRATEVGKVVP
ncbi:MAG TPA: protein kinase [Candidatus Limnocylindrales bacterium]|nr:protein kinase [Candidatus Limnocylindrales bacterium]